ncbi:MAG: hypothetical protein WBF55_01280, partial [Syntrophobacteria bacterium]
PGLCPGQAGQAGSPGPFDKLRASSPGTGRAGDLPGTLRPIRPIRQAQDRQAPRDPSTSSGQARPGQAGQVEHGEKIEGASGSRDRLVRPLAQRQKKKTLTDRGMVASEGQSLRE